MVFHHYDRLGLIPQSWSEALVALQATGWQVVLSSSYIDPSVSAELVSAGVQIVCRANIGLCLGAYRDLALLVQSTPEVRRKLQALVLCNDSNLLVQPPDVLVAQLDQWKSAYSSKVPVLAGLTDSVERHRYHLQSFLLHANQALLQHPAWLRFWLHFSIDGSKDDLIDHGEIGLSQALLAAGVVLQPASNGAGLTYRSSDGRRAERLWHRSARACQSKSVRLAQSFGSRFSPCQKACAVSVGGPSGAAMAIAELAGLIPNERRALLTRDIEQLLISRYSGGSPRMG